MFIGNNRQEIATTISKLKQEGDILLDCNTEIRTKPTGYQQDESRNGGILKQITEETDMVILHTTQDRIKWNRENRTKNTEKSIIDYICNTER